MIFEEQFPVPKYTVARTIHRKCLCGNLCGPSTAHIDACAYKMPSCWIVDERSAWKPPHGRKARRCGVSPHHVPPFSRGVIFTRARVSLAPLSKNGGYSSSMFGTRDEARSPSFWPSTSHVSYSSPRNDGLFIVPSGRLWHEFDIKIILLIS